MPEIMQNEKVKIIERYNGKIHLVDAEKELKDRAIHGAYIELGGRYICRDREAKEPNVWWARQFSNRNNTRGHHKTGREIIEHFEGKVDAFVASVGTGGTFLGISEVLNKEWPDVKCYAVEPAEVSYMTLTNFDVIPGISGGILKDVMNSGLVEEVIKVRDEDAVEMGFRISKEEGLFTGFSAGANVFAAINVAKKLGKGKNVVTVSPDSGDRYFSGTHFIT